MRYEEVVQELLQRQLEIDLVSSDDEMRTKRGDCVWIASTLGGATTRDLYLLQGGIKRVALEVCTRAATGGISNMLAQRLLRSLHSLQHLVHERLELNMIRDKPYASA